MRNFVTLRYPVAYLRVPLISWITRKKNRNLKLIFMKLEARRFLHLFRSATQWTNQLPLLPRFTALLSHLSRIFFPTLLRSDTYVKSTHLFILYIVLFLEFCGVIGLLYSTNMLFLRSYFSFILLPQAYFHISLLKSILSNLSLLGDMVMRSQIKFSIKNSHNPFS